MDEQSQTPCMNEAFRLAAARAAIAVSFAALVGVGAFGAQQAHQARQADMDPGRVRGAPVAPALVPAGTVLTHAPDHLRAVPLPEDFNLEILGDSPTGS